MLIYLWIILKQRLIRKHIVCRIQQTGRKIQTGSVLYDKEHQATRRQPIRMLDLISLHTRFPHDRCIAR